MIFFDTSFLIGLLIPDDPHHEKAVGIMSLFNQNTTFKVTQDVLKEFLTVVTYKVSSTDAIKLFNYVFENRDVFEIVYDDYSSNFEETLILYQTLGSHKFSYTDCSLIAFAKSLGCEVLTFDKTLEKVIKGS